MNDSPQSLKSIFEQALLAAAAYAILRAWRTQRIKTMRNTWAR